MKKLSALLGVLILTACATPKVSQTDGAADGKVEIKIVQINDVYEIDPLNDGAYGGLARVAHVRDSIKKQNPNTFVFLAGDFLNPSLLGTVKVEGERLQGKQMVDVLNAVDIDLVTFGNHEFDLKEADLQKRLNESRFAWTSANTRHVTSDGLQPFYSHRDGTEIPVSDYEIYEIVDADGDRVKFGVVGVTIDSNPKDYVAYADVYSEMTRAYNEAQKEADFVLGLTHVALNQDQEIARRIPELPLIMGGHEHYNMIVKEGKTIITKADANAKTVYVHTLLYDLKSKNLIVDSELVPINADTPSDSEVETLVNGWVEVLDANLKEIIENPDEVIFNAEIPWDGTDEASRSIQTNVGDVITRAMTFVYPETQAAIVNGGSIRVDDKLSGVITSKDIFRILLFGGEVLKVELKGKLLIDVLDYGVKASGTGAYLQRYNLDKNPEGNWMLNQAVIQSEEIYAVAMSDFLLLGLDIPFLTADHEDIISVYRPTKDETAKDIRKAIIQYLKKDQK